MFSYKRSGQSLEEKQFVRDTKIMFHKNNCFKLCSDVLIWNLGTCIVAVFLNSRKPFNWIYSFKGRVELKPFFNPKYTRKCLDFPLWHKSGTYLYMQFLFSLLVELKKIQYERKGPCPNLWKTITDRLSW